MQKFATAALIAASFTAWGPPTVTLAQVPSRFGPATIPPDAPRPGTPGFIAWWTAHGPKRAPPGYQYEVDSYVISPTDACWREEMFTPGAVGTLNASVGKEGGLPKRIDRVDDLASPDGVRLASVGVRLPRFGQASISCHATLHFSDGSSSGGIFTINDPGKYAELQVAWISDLDIAAARARSSNLQTATNLYVKPNLTDPRIQACVGRETALGAGEEFRGQLWVACADKLSKER
jgi:hypothetical protein